MYRCVIRGINSCFVLLLRRFNSGSLTNSVSADKQGKALYEVSGRAARVEHSRAAFLSSVRSIIRLFVSQSLDLSIHRSIYSSVRSFIHRSIHTSSVRLDFSDNLLRSPGDGSPSPASTSILTDSRITTKSTLSDSRHRVRIVVIFDSRVAGHQLNNRLRSNKREVVSSPTSLTGPCSQLREGGVSHDRTFHFITDRSGHTAPMITTL